MIQKIMKTHSFNATSVIKFGNKEESVAFMSGSLSNEGELNFNYSIANKELFDTNREEVERDFEAFKDTLLNFKED